MATNVVFEAHTPAAPGNGVGGKVSATISLADVVVNVAPTAVGTFTTATVTADLQRSILITPAAGVTNGIPAGWYENAGPALFRKV